MKKDSENYLHWQVRCDILVAELKAADARNKLLVGALEPLVRACIEEFAGPTMDEFPDDEAVGGSAENEMVLTFGMIRRASEALAKTRGNTDAG